MTNEEHVELINQRLDAWNELINQGVDAWNKWRSEHSYTRPDLMSADLGGANLSGANLSWTSLLGTDLSGANLSAAKLTYAQLVETNVENANLTGCQIYGISAWNVKVNQETKQSDLIITDWDEATVTVDNLEVAQFMYLLLNNQ